MILIITVGLILFAILAVLKPEQAFYLIIILLPSYQLRFQILNTPFTFLEGMILILALISSWRGAWTTQQAGNNKLTLIFIMTFFIAGLVSIFISPVPIKAAGIFKAYFFEAILFYFLTINLITTRQKLNRVFASLAILTLYVSGFGIYQFFTLANLPFSWWGVEIASRRIVSILNHPNAVALLLGPILAMLTITHHKSKLSWAALVLGLAAFYLTLSRAGWLALIVTITGFYILSSLSGPGEWLKERSRSLVKAITVIVIIVIVMIALPFSRNQLFRLAQNDPSKQNRFVLWSAAIDMVKHHPIAGVGLMGFHEYYKNYPLGPDRVVQNYPHNFFLTFSLETGLLGLLSMLGLLIIFYKKIYGALKKGTERSLALAAGAGMTMIVLHSLVDVSYFKNDLSVLFWLVYALPNLYIKYN